jgi:selenocysteine lyase/cysteine desulfurase
VANPIIPTFNTHAYDVWMKARPPADLPKSVYMTPGGFHSFEHRWALDEAFTFHRAIGKARVTQRIYELNQQMKQGLAKMPHITLHTPMSQDLSAGIICFEVSGMTPGQVVERLRHKRIIGSVTPYATQYARLAPSLLTLPEDIEQALREILKLRT